MPLYDWRCEQCDTTTEAFFKMADKPKSIPCPQCGGEAQQIISLGHGGIQAEWPVWLDNNVRSAIQDPRERPIETRSEYKKLLKNKGIVARE